LQRHAPMLESASRRRGLLCDSKKCNEFIRTCGELITWINAKLQLAYDESYLDPTNLRSKLQKHLAFDSELSENEKRLVAVEALGEQLISKSAESSYLLHLSDESRSWGPKKEQRDKIVKTRRTTTTSTPPQLASTWSGSRYPWSTDSGPQEPASLSYSDLEQPHVDVGSRNGGRPASCTRPAPHRSALTPAVVT
uniref:PH domain-containing protein n=1 Tax=Heligmosomoides polygyrus TaxID=6339 RepID=A0A183G6D8_HELPZ